MPILTSRVFEKVLVFVCLIACASSLLPLCILGGSFSLLCLMRITYGFSQNIVISFVAAWVDTFADSKLIKAFQFHMILIGQALAYFIGYGVTGLMISSQSDAPPPEEVPADPPVEGEEKTEPMSIDSWAQPWRVAIFLQILLLIPCILLIMSLPLKYFDLKAAQEMKDYRKKS